MAIFGISIKKVLEFEGGYSDHENDLGGKTRYGITERVANKNGFDVKKITVEQAESIYKKSYWDKMKLDKVLDQNLANNIMDYAVNSGKNRSGKAIQSVLNDNFNMDLVKDGFIGNETIKAINKIKGINIHLFIYKFKFERIEFLTNIKSFNTFGRGWIKRVLEV